MSYMKVLLCERSLSGHRRVYLEYLTAIDGVELYCFAPENVGVSKDHFVPCVCDNPKSYSAYFKWVRQIKEVVREKHIDVVHISDGDSIRRFFGIGFGGFHAKTVITYHHFFEGKLSNLSYVKMSGKKQMSGGKRISVVHTDSVRENFEKIGIRNISVVEYPAFSFDEISGIESGKAKERFGLPAGVPAIGIIGSLVGYKRILQFLQVLNRCQADFRLLICGNPSEITENEIRDAVEAYKDKVILLPRKLTEEEYNEAIAASDIIYSIYGTEFDGASGPLMDGVCCGKMILASAHGSLGNIVKNNHLGLTCDCMNEDEVLKSTEASIREVMNFTYDEIALAYRNRLRPERFQADYKKIYMD